MLSLVGATSPEVNGHLVETCTDLTRLLTATSLTNANAAHSILRPPSQPAGSLRVLKKTMTGSKDLRQLVNLNAFRLRSRRMRSLPE